MKQSSKIYSLGYEKWEGNRGYAIPAFLLIAQSSIRNIVTSSGCLARLVFSSFFIIYYFVVAASSLARFQLENLKKFDFFRSLADLAVQGAIDPLEKDFHTFFVVGGEGFSITIPFLLAMMVFYGGQLISKDRRANALQVYFSKAVGRVDYLLGKFLSVGIITSTVTLVPSALILGIGLVFSTDHMLFFKESWFIPFSAGLNWLAMTMVFGSITLFFSSCYNKSYMAGVTIFAFPIFCAVFSLLMRTIFGDHQILHGFNWFAGMFHIGEALYQMEVETWSLMLWRIIDISLMCGLFIWFTARNIRPVEVIK